MTGNYLNILFVSAEFAPYAKVGGLADVAGSLPKALADLGHKPSCMMPGYRRLLEDPRWSFETVLDSIPIKVSETWTVNAWVKSIDHGGVPLYLVGADGYFTGDIYSAGVEQYLFFSEAVLQVAQALNLSPDVVHGNDWHTGLIPLLMREKHAKEWQSASSVFTIHNLAYQGEFEPSILKLVDLPEKLFNLSQLEAYGSVNFLKAGCVYSDQVNTVSPTYAQEIQSPEYGCRLDGLMSHLSSEDRLTGILNGIDYEVFNPEIDPALPTHFNQEDLSGKVTCKARLLAELGLPVRPSTPLMATISRLSSQKGIDLIADLVPLLAKLPAQLVIQGLGDEAIAGRLRELAGKHPKTFKFVERFDAELAQRIYAGADMFLMPSAFEPCGLGQMIAMRYGTVPIVRKTGGLADTIVGGRNGFVFEDLEAADLWQALLRANEEYRNIADWGHFINDGMAAANSWRERASSYDLLYKKAREGNGGSVKKAASA